MKFKPIEYMEWAKKEPGSAAINLARSGLYDLAIEDLELDPREFQIQRKHENGYPPLLEALAKRLAVGVENVMPSLGASQGIFYACAALLERGDEALVERPVYEPLCAVPSALGARVRRFERRFENGFQVDLGELRSAINPATRLIILTNPHNPSGVLLDSDLLDGLLALAAERGVIVFVDEIYLGFQEGDQGRTAFLRAPNVISASSLTKVFGLSGLRCGWLLAPKEIVRAMRIIRDHLNVEEVFIAEQISTRAIPRLDSLFRKIKPLVEGNLATVREFMKGQKTLSWVEPARGLIAFPRVNSPLGGDGLARLCRERYDTAIVPGRFFEDSRHFRMGWGIPGRVLAEGLDNIARALRELD